MKFLHLDEKVVASVFVNPGDECFTAVSVPTAKILAFTERSVDDTDSTLFTLWAMFYFKIVYTPLSFYDFTFCSVYAVDLHLSVPTYGEKLGLMQHAVARFKLSLEADSRSKLPAPIPVSYDSVTCGDGKLVNYIGGLIRPYTMKWPKR